MHKDAKSFSFLFTRRSKSNNRIFIRRVQISRSVMQNCFLSFALVFGLSILGLGIFGFLKLADGGELAHVGSEKVATQAVTRVPVEQRVINYSRPDGAAEMALNSGGPYSPDQLVIEDQEVENRLKLIQATSDPMNLPTIWAHSGKINNEFGFRKNPFGGRSYEFHNGMDIDGERGDPIVAPASGTVLRAGWQGGYGNLVEIDHGNGLITRYGHMSKVEVEAGKTVSRGVLIGYVGSTGRSTGPHLHYELLLGDRPINPRRFLPQEPIDLSQIGR